MDDRKLLRKNYEDACKAYLKAFCQKHGLIMMMPSAAGISMEEEV